jgi:hypothetical protein
MDLAVFCQTGGAERLVYEHTTSTRFPGTAALARWLWAYWRPFGPSEVSRNGNRSLADWGRTTTVLVAGPVAKFDADS